MIRSTLSHSVTPALTAWRDLVSNGPTGPGIDFTDTNRTHACEQQLDAFLTTPSSDTFRELWDGDAIASYWAPSAGVLLGSDSAVDSLQDVCGEMREADAFDPTWLDRLAGSDPGWGIHELYARLQGGADPIPTLEAQTVLRSLGYDDVGADAPDELVTALKPLARRNSPGTLETSGYVVHSLQTALYDGLVAESAEEAIVTAVNRGGDTDTIGAIAGAVAGARFGASGLPDRWLDAIDEADELESLATQLVEIQ